MTINVSKLASEDPLICAARPRSTISKIDDGVGPLEYARLMEGDDEEVQVVALLVSITR